MDVDVHRASGSAGAAVVALFLVPLDFQEGEAARDFEDRCNGAKVFAESPVVLQKKRHWNRRTEVEEVPGHQPVELSKVRLHGSVSKHRPERQNEEEAAGEVHVS